jgi:hypothetical protein
MTVQRVPVPMADDERSGRAEAPAHSRDGGVQRGAWVIWLLLSPHVVAQAGIADHPPTREQEATQGPAGPSGRKRPIEAVDPQRQRTQDADLHRGRSCHCWSHRREHAETTSSGPP